MKKMLIFGGIFVGALIGAVVAFVFFIYITNRTIDHSLATNLAVSKDWTEISADPPLTAFRMVQELAIAIPGYRLDRNEKLPIGQIRLPDGRIATPEIQALDKSGKWERLEFSGHTMSRRDFVIYRPKYDLDGNSLTKIRIRSDESFACEEVFWRNRNPK
jgi:hypothetical protein